MEKQRTYSSGNTWQLNYSVTHLFGRPWLGGLGFLTPLLARRGLPSSFLWGWGEDRF